MTSGDKPFDNEDPFSFPEITQDDKLIVNVLGDGDNKRWYANALNDPPTIQEEVLYGIIESIGGINVITPPGLYHFSIDIEGWRNGEGRFVIKLDPIDRQ